MAVRGGWRRRHRRRLPLAAHQDGGGRAAELAEHGGSLAGGRLLLRLQDDPLGHLCEIKKTPKNPQTPRS